MAVEEQYRRCCGFLPTAFINRAEHIVNIVLEYSKPVFILFLQLEHGTLVGKLVIIERKYYIFNTSLSPLTKPRTAALLFPNILLFDILYGVIAPRSFLSKGGSIQVWFCSFQKTIAANTSCSTGIVYNWSRPLFVSQSGPSFLLLGNFGSLYNSFHSLSPHLLFSGATIGLLCSIRFKFTLNKFQLSVNFE